jgi:hypothetical protein
MTERDVIDYNGSGRWSRDAIVERYKEYARRYRISRPLWLVPRDHTNGATVWIYPVMHDIIDGIEKHDRAAAEIGVEFIQENASFPFGQILKSNTARALRRCRALTPEHEEVIRQRIVEMLRTEYLPREFRQYAKLARRVGMKSALETARDSLNFENHWVAHYYESLTEGR